MRSAIVGVAILVVAAGLTGCGRGRDAGRNCFDYWNASSNRFRQGKVAGRFTIASVSRWRAQAAGGNVGGPPSFGCGYLFHTSQRYLSISGMRTGDTIRWGVPPTIHGPWSPEQQRAAPDNADVDADGLLSSR